MLTEKDKINFTNISLLDTSITFQLFSVLAARDLTEEALS
jgi:hypothetical protein